MGGRLPPRWSRKMLDPRKCARISYDLGYGDGRNIIAAATSRRPSLGSVNPDMWSCQERADSAGVAEKEQLSGDMSGRYFQANVWRGSLAQQLLQLRSKFSGAPARESSQHGFISRVNPIRRCSSRLRELVPAILYIVPANASGTWRLPR